MIDTALRTITESGLQVIGRLLGSENSRKLIICSHGFGVLSDSHGMYNQICETFKDSYLTARFHYVSVDELTNSTYVYEYSRQVEKLKTIYDKLVEKYNISEVVIISHSQGCTITSLFLEKYKPKVDKVIFLAYPPNSDITNKMTRFFGNRDGAKIDMDGLSTFPRSDGSTTIVPPAFWQDADKANPPELFKVVNQEYDTYFVRAMRDEVVAVDKYHLLDPTSLKHYFELPNVHGFSDDDRLGLITLLHEIL